MYLNIEKSDIDFAEEGYSQPNVIRLKPSSKANILVNRLNVPVSNINNSNVIEEYDNTISDEKENIGKIVVAETSIADLFLFDKDSEMDSVGSKPINLSAKMFENVRKKHNDYIEKMNNLKSEDINKIYVENNESNNDAPENSDENIISEIENEEISNVFDAIDSVINDNDIQNENVAQDDIEDELIGLNNTTSKFIELVNDETQTEKDLSVAKEQFVKVSGELEEANEIEKQIRDQLMHSDKYEGDIGGFDEVSYDETDVPPSEDEPF